MHEHTSSRHVVLYCGGPAHTSPLLGCTSHMLQRSHVTCCVHPEKLGLDAQQTTTGLKIIQKNNQH